MGYLLANPSKFSKSTFDLEISHNSLSQLSFLSMEIRLLEIFKFSAMFLDSYREKLPKGIVDAFGLRNNLALSKGMGSKAFALRKSHTHEDSSDLLCKQAVAAWTAVKMGGEWHSGNVVFSYVINSLLDFCEQDKDVYQKDANDLAELMQVSIKDEIFKIELLAKARFQPDEATEIFFKLCKSTNEIILEKTLDYTCKNLKRDPGKEIVGKLLLGYIEERISRWSYEENPLTLEKTLNTTPSDLPDELLSLEKIHTILRRSLCKMSNMTALKKASYWVFIRQRLIDVISNKFVAQRDKDDLFKNIESYINIYDKHQAVAEKKMGLSEYEELNLTNTDLADENFIASMKNDIKNSGLNFKEKTSQQSIENLSSSFPPGFVLIEEID